MILTLLYTIFLHIPHTRLSGINFLAIQAVQKKRSEYIRQSLEFLENQFLEHLYLAVFFRD